MFAKKAQAVRYTEKKEELDMIYVISDLHGYPLPKFKKLLKSAGFSNKDYCFILGDVIDRGEDGIAILEWLLYQPNIQLIRGNHEDMMLKCKFLFEPVTEESVAALDSEQVEAMFTWYNNGAETTVSHIRECDDETVDAIFEYLEDSAFYERVTVNGQKYLLVHGGLGRFDPDKRIGDYSPRDLLWNRPVLDDIYYGDVITVFGHTPTYYYGDEYSGHIIVTDTWIDIDTGAAAGLPPTLLRLDDMKTFKLDD